MILLYGQHKFKNYCLESSSLVPYHSHISKPDKEVRFGIFCQCCFRYDDKCVGCDWSCCLMHTDCHWLTRRPWTKCHMFMTLERSSQVFKRRLFLIPSSLLPSLLQLHPAPESDYWGCPVWNVLSASQSFPRPSQPLTFCRVIQEALIWSRGSPFVL